MKTNEQSSMEIDVKEKEHMLEINTKKVDVELEAERWQCCSFNLHPASSLFFGKLFISIFVVALCSFQLITQQDCSVQSLYSSILSTVIVFWLNNKTQ
jgi:hypothetical protein